MSLIRPQQRIYFGAPGTGKSFLVAQETRGKSVIRTTIHPDYSYADFVGQILPTEGDDGAVRFSFVPGPLTEAIKAAYADRSVEVCLVLEELSRGNVAAVFGDTFQLLDRGADGNSRYGIFNRMIASQLLESEENLRNSSTHEVMFPANLSIFATVNVNDQNVAPMDTAFKRRFDWQYVDSSPAVGGDGSVDTRLNNPAIAILSSDAAIETNWLSFYSALNAFIVDSEIGMGRNEDRQVGQFFLDFGHEVIADSYSQDATKRRRAADVITEVVKNKLLQYLWQDVEGHSSGLGRRSLFHKSVTSFGELFRRFDGDQVFSDDFLNLFLKEHRNKYLY